MRNTPRRRICLRLAPLTTKEDFHTTDTIPLPMLLPTAIRTMLSARWCARFAATLPPDSMLSRCSYSVVGAYRLIETGEGPVDSF